METRLSGVGGDHVPWDGVPIAGWLTRAGGGNFLLVAFAASAGVAVKDIPIPRLLVCPCPRVCVLGIRVEGTFCPGEKRAPANRPLHLFPHDPKRFRPHCIPCFYSPFL